LWKDEDIKAIDGSLEAAAKRGITILVSAGDRGATDAMADKHRHVEASDDRRAPLARISHRTNARLGEYPRRRVCSVVSMLTGGAGRREVLECRLISN
jgi:hypothetical protein